MECRLAHTPDDWSCQISVRWEFDDYGAPLGEVYEVPFGPLVTLKTDVEPLLRRAQAAVLNGWMSDEELDQFAREGPKSKSASKKTLAFSRNTICVDLKGPELVDLSFVDLPGERDRRGVLCGDLDSYAQVSWPTRTVRSSGSSRTSSPLT